jgi:hypothetical protein
MGRESEPGKREHGGIFAYREFVALSLFRLLVPETSPPAP